MLRNCQLCRPARLRQLQALTAALDVSATNVTLTPTTCVEIAALITRAVSPQELNASMIHSGTQATSSKLPPLLLFTSLGGDPGAPEPEQQAAADQFWQETAAVFTALSSLARHLQHNGSSLIQTVQQQDAAGMAQPPSRKTARVLIEELPAQHQTSFEINFSTQADTELYPAADMLLLIALYGEDYQLGSPWTAPNVSDAAAGLLQGLSHSVGPLQTAVPSLSSNQLQASKPAKASDSKGMQKRGSQPETAQPTTAHSDAERVQSLLGSTFAGMAKHARKILVQKDHSEQQKLEPYKGETIRLVRDSLHVSRQSLTNVVAGVLLDAYLEAAGFRHT